MPNKHELVFPENKILWQSTCVIGGQNIEAIKLTLKKDRITVPYDIEQMINKLDTNISKSLELIKLVGIRIGDLNFTYPPLINELYQGAKKYNFYPLRFDVIGESSLYEVPENDEIIIPVKSPITDSNNYPPYVLSLNRIGGKLQLGGGVVEPGVRFGLDNKIIFSCHNTPKNSTVAKK